VREVAIATSSADKSGIGEEFGERDRLAVGQLGELGYHTRSARVSSATRGIWHQVFVGPYKELEIAKQDQLRVRQLPGYADAQLVTQ